MKKLITIANLTFTKKKCNCGLQSKTNKQKLLKVNIKRKTKGKHTLIKYYIIYSYFINS